MTHFVSGCNAVTYYLFRFQLNIHKFKCVARFGLAHIVATNLCVWMRTVVKECTKEIAQYRVDRGHGVSEDYMILGNYILSKHVSSSANNLSLFYVSRGI